MKCALCMVIYVIAAHAQSPTPTIAAKTSSMHKMAGYFPLYWDDKAGRLWLEIDKFNTEFLYVDSLPAGVGSNDIGLDRGQIGGSRIVRFERSGPRVLLVQPNYQFRAAGGDAEEKRAVAESFAESVLWGFDSQAEEGDRVLVDATPFFLRDAHHVPQAIQNARPIGGAAQGNTSGTPSFHLDATRSALYLARTKNFPKNTEVEATLTFTSDNPSGFIVDVTPSPEAVTVREHHSFVELPGPGFKGRAYDARSGYFGVSYADYATPLGDSLVKRLIARHRLAKKDARAAMSEAVQPIVYYVDRGTPEPIRSALLEGASWWNEAFASAGYKNAFRVELLPADADPMDVRYNLIQWVHRHTRGWSYGEAVTDPRTGEIIKGQVTLGSLRGRQDYMIMEGLLAPYEAGKPAPPEMQRAVLARLRQLAAHEVGHTLGLQHNFAASAKNRASVMDYPPPVTTLDAAGIPDVASAYATGIGDWDKIAIQYGYQDFAPGVDEAKQLDRLMRRATTEGFLYISDADARPEGGAHPQAHLWDSGTNAVSELNRILDVRAHALQRFSEKNIREGEPMSHLEDVLVPIYLFHRYQTEAAAKVLGGLFYTYALRGDGQRVTEHIAGDEQRRALDALLRTMSPETLTLPASILKLIPPSALGYPRTRENFGGHTGLTFDPVAAAESAADLTAGLILNAERAARLVQYHAEDARAPSLDDVIYKLLRSTWEAPPVPGLAGQVQRAVNAEVLFHLIQLAADEKASSQVRATAYARLSELRRWLTSATPAYSDLEAFYALAAEQIKRFEANPKEFAMPRPAPMPPGQPIGDEDFGFAPL